MIAKTIALGMTCLALAWAAAPAAKAETIKIGVISPLTGGGAPWGIAAAQAAKIAAAETNAKGGLVIGGKSFTIDVISYDDQYKAANTIAAYNRLVNEDGVKFMIVHTSPAAMAVKQNVEDDKVIALTAAANPAAIDAKTRFMFRMDSIPQDYAPALVDWWKANLKQRRVAIVNPNDETGWPQAKLIEGLLKKDGFDVVANELYERAQKDFQPLFTRLIALNPEMIDLASVPPATTGLMVRQARELGYKGLFVKSSGPSPKEIVSAAGAEAAEGMILLLFADPANAGYQRISAAYKSNVGQDPNEMLVPCYDSINVMLRAIQLSGDPTDTAKVSQAFSSALPMTSVLSDPLTLGGKANYGSDQQIMTSFYIGKIVNGAPVIVGKIK